MKIIKFFIYPIILALLIVFVYGKLTSSFFQQDEWLTFGGFLNSQSNGGYLGFLYNTMINSGGIHVIPLAVARSYLQIETFHLNFSSYAVLSILNHIVNTFLVFYLATILLKKRFLAFLVGLIYAVSSISSQSVTWIAATINTQNSDSFLLLSLIFLFKYIKDKSNIKLLIVSLISIFIGLLFKENLAIAIFIFPAFWAIFSDKKNKKTFYKFSLSIFVVMFIYFAIRFSATIMIPQTIVNSVSPSWESPTVETYLYRAITFPLKIIPQSIIPANFIIKIANKIVYLGYPQYFASSASETNTYVVQTVLFDMVAYALGLLIIAICFYLYRYFVRKKPELAKALAFSLVLITISILPLLFLPGRGGYFYIFEPRHLSIAVIGASLIVCLLLYGFVSRFIKEEKVIYTLIFILLIPILVIYIKQIRADIRTLVYDGDIRRNIISTIYNKYSTLPKRAVIFAQSDTAYYGLPIEEKILPFQSGFGQTLMVWYGFYNSLPACLFKGDFLYEIHSQGYEECDGYGFGYFRKIKDLKKAVNEKVISPSAVIGYSFDSHNQTLTDITASLRKDLTH